MTNTKNIPTNVATYDTRYDLVGVETPLKCVGLYEAVKALEEVANAGLLNDGTHIRRSGRHVAFFSAWRNEVTPMFEAADSEREVIGMWRP